MGSVLMRRMSQLSTDSEHLSGDERRALAAAIPILRGIADRRLTTDASAP